jgi:uncharacterized membrane protein
MSLPLLKTIHLIGVILFIGNIVVTALWKMVADRTRDIAVIRYATGMVNVTDILFTVGGVAVLLGAGQAMAPSYGGVMATKWILWSYALLAGTGLIWIFLLLPIQITQSRLLKSLGPQEGIPARYWALSRWWAVAGAIATVLPLPAIYLMVAKPVL